MINFEDLTEEEQELYQQIIEANLIDSTTKVKSSDGKMWRLKDLALRDIRTAIANDLMDNTMNLMDYYDQDLCFTSYLPDSSTLCLNFQNRIYTVKQTTSSRYSWIDNALWRNGGGLIHPNCRHTIEPYFEGITELEEGSGTSKKEVKKNYKNRQDYLNADRNETKWKEKAEIARLSGLDDSYYKAKAREWNRRKKQFDDLEDTAFDL